MNSESREDTEMRARQNVLNLLEGWDSAVADFCVFLWAGTVQQHHLELDKCRLSNAETQGLIVLLTVPEE